MCISFPIQIEYYPLLNVQPIVHNITHCPLHYPFPIILPIAHKPYNLLSPIAKVQWNCQAGYSTEHKWPAHSPLMQQKSRSSPFPVLRQVIVAWYPLLIAIAWVHWFWSAGFCSTGRISGLDKGHTSYTILCLPRPVPSPSLFIGWLSCWIEWHKYIGHTSCCLMQQLQII